MCCYREVKNFERFIKLTNCIVLCTLQQLQEIQENEHKNETTSKTVNNTNSEVENEKDSENLPSKSISTSLSKSKVHWTHQDREKLFHLLSKIFLLNFPLYIAMKHGGAINLLGPLKVRQCLSYNFTYLLILIT